MQTIEIELEGKKVISAQKEFFEQGKCLDLTYRKNTLKKLRKVILEKEKEICDAVYKDFKKSEFEALLSETQFTLAELDTTIKKMSKWARRERVSSNLANFPSSDYIYKEPYGNVLVISPWNYPFNLAMSPLIAAVAAGNTVCLKPSELTPHTSALTRKIVQEVFEPGHVTIVEGGVETAQDLLSQRWDYIFFTGSVPVGKIVYQAAAKHLTPVTLELGGKSPCIIDASANLELTARRLVWGKLLNGGQTCIAPDYLLVEDSIKNDLVKAMEKAITKAYGEDPALSPDYPRIINEKNFDRLAAMLEDQNILVGGATQRDDCYIAPTLVDEPALDSAVMQEEIFGPILPVLTWKTEEDIHKVISSYEKPLAFYVFSSKKKKARKLIESYSFGGGCINDSIIHIANTKLPFGGVGHSGIGAYHGKKSFDTFTHHKSVVHRGTWLDVPVRYAPYTKKINLAKHIRKLF
ncbi:aldehyde dehydrogenase [Robertkochia marina]|uniref:Aldehyde dehydrogenase n=1 Tax=Robertkochia marina TaxID=1227945 RepID=A0A4S3LZW3_9FLAO|nr:aldehyde dehydrogenase [Robertkochia marina]THD67690.1 aldehyde dehydrogenase [Robertkochia marina]TRZ43421.1 aldehyde dehydrogenase [Robertkochia marina]